MKIDWISIVVWSCLFVCCVGCDRPASVRSALAGQRNANMTFYGLAIDQDGNPLEGVQFDTEVESVPRDWTFETRDRPHSFSKVSATSGKDGRFEVQFVGQVLRFNRVEKKGYRHFYDLDAGSDIAIDNTFY